MTTHTTGTAAEVRDLGLFARATGVIFSPRATFAAIVARPRSLPMLVLIILLTAVPTGWFMSTAVGRQAMLDQAEKSLKFFSMFIPADQMEQQRAKLATTYLEGSFLRVAGWPMAMIIIMTPLIAAIYAGLLLLLRLVLGAEGTFKQVYAVVVYSWIITALATIFLTPLNYVRESMDSATSLRVFFPMIDDGSLVASLLGSVDLFRVWWVILLSIGLGVLFRRKTSTIAVSLFGVYGVVALGYAIIAAMFAARS
jgi:Yip1 domain